MTSGAALKLNAVNYSIAEPLSLNGTGISGGGALVNSGISTFAGPITAATSASISAGGGTQAFTATVENTLNTAVTWQVGGVTGGNSTVGTISTSGLYTAPVVVPSSASLVVSQTQVALPSKAHE